MKTELIKTAISWGNSSGVRLPKEWEGKKTRIQLIENSIKEDIIQYLIEDNLLQQVLGIYLTGSYARGEETTDSDIDILIITNNINKEIKHGDYEILLISKNELERKINKSLYLYSQIKEAKTILNDSLLEKYKSLKIKNYSYKYLNEIKKIIKLNMKLILLEIIKKERISENMGYSIILRLREILLIDSIINNKPYSKSNLLKKIKKYDLKLEYYNAYLNIKKNRKSKIVLNPKTGENLLTLSKKLILDIEKTWDEKRN
tara:strand:- start:643 stop:1422 length:780 start_codon:yes stop_codon:yes gene_type:complete